MNASKFPQQVVVTERREGPWAALRRLFSGKRGVEWHLYWEGTDEGLQESGEAAVKLIASRARAMALLGFEADLEVIWEPCTRAGQVMADIYRNRFTHRTA